MTYHIGDKVRVKETAFPKSDDPRDATYRGQVGKLVTDLANLFGKSWDGCWEIQLPDGEITIVDEDEIETVEEQEA